MRRVGRLDVGPRHRGQATRRARGRRATSRLASRLRRTGGAGEQRRPRPRRRRRPRLGATSQLDGEIGIGGFERGLRAAPAASAACAASRRRAPRRALRSSRARPTVARRSRGAIARSTRPRGRAEHGRDQERAPEGVREQRLPETRAQHHEQHDGARRGTPRCARSRASRRAPARRRRSSRRRSRPTEPIDRGSERNERGRTTVAERVERPRQQAGTRCTRRARRRAMRARRRAARGCSTPGAITFIAGSDSARNAADTGSTRIPIRSSAQRTRSANVGGVTAVRVERDVGKDRGVHRLREDRVRGHERDERELVGDHATFDAVAHHDRRCRAGSRCRRAEAPPTPTGAAAPEPRVGSHEPGPELEPGTHRARRPGTPTNPTTPSNPPIARISFSSSERSRPGSGPATTRNTTSAATTNTVFAMGAIAVITKWRLA